MELSSVWEETYLPPADSDAPPVPTWSKKPNHLSGPAKQPQAKFCPAIDSTRSLNLGFLVWLLDSRRIAEDLCPCRLRCGGPEHATPEQLLE